MLWGVLKHLRFENRVRWSKRGPAIEHRGEVQERLQPNKRRTLLTHLRVNKMVCRVVWEPLQVRGKFAFPIDKIISATIQNFVSFAFKLFQEKSFVNVRHSGIIVQFCEAYEKCWFVLRYRKCRCFEMSSLNMYVVALLW